MFFRSKPPNAASLAGVLIAVTLADLNPIFSKVLLLEGLTPLQLYFGVLLVMNLFLLVHEMMALERGERWGMTRSDFLGTVLSTLTGGICAPMLFFTGLQSITASEGIILTSLLPFFIIVFAVLLLKERFTMQMAIGSGFLFAGVIAILWEDALNFHLSIGAPLVIASTILSGLTTIVHKRFIVHRHLDSIVFVRTLASMVVIGLWLFLTEPGGFEFLLSEMNVWLFLALPILSFLLPFFLYFRSLRHVHASTAGILAALGRVIALVVAAVVLGESIDAQHVLSVFLVVFGIFFINVPLTKWHIVPSRLLGIGPLRK